jgi:hypothetical protein
LANSEYSPLQASTYTQTAHSRKLGVSKRRADR